MNGHDIEELLRESLRTRAEDVSATPDLWNEVEERARQRRWRARFAVLGSVAAAVAVLVLAIAFVPGLLPDGDTPTILDEPDEPAEQPEPDDSEPLPDPRTERVPERQRTAEVPPVEEVPTWVPGTGGLPTGVPPTYVATDGRSIALRATTSDDEGWSIEVASAGETVTSLAVRPGSDHTDLTVAFHVATSDGGHSMRYLVAREGEVTVTSFADHGGQYAVGGDIASGARPRPVWAPDGAAIAWVELPADETASGPGLRVIGWSDGPGTGSTATDNAAFTLDDIPLTAVGADAWALFGEPGAATTRTAIFLTSRELEAWNVVLERQGDGAYAMTETNRLAHPNGTVVAFAPDLLEGGPRPSFVVIAEPDGDGLRLGIHDDLGHQALTTPQALAGADPDRVWLRGTTDHVLAGDGSSAWITARPGGLERSLSGTVRSADWVD
jgi:hypothetical protein